MLINTIPAQKVFEHFGHNIRFNTILSIALLEQNTIDDLLQCKIYDRCLGVYHNRWAALRIVKTFVLII